MTIVFFVHLNVARITGKFRFFFLNVVSQSLTFRLWLLQKEIKVY